MSFRGAPASDRRRDPGCVPCRIWPGSTGHGRGCRGPRRAPARRAVGAPAGSSAPACRAEGAGPRVGACRSPRTGRRRRASRRTPLRDPREPGFPPMRSETRPERSRTTTRGPGLPDGRRPRSPQRLSRRQAPRCALKDRPATCAWKPSIGGRHGATRGSDGASRAPPATRGTRARVGPPHPATGRWSAASLDRRCGATRPPRPRTRRAWVRPRPENSPMAETRSTLT